MIAQAQTPPRQPPLWRAQCGDKTVWLFGGFHSMKAHHLWLTAQIAEAARSAATVFFESKASTSMLDQMASVFVMGQPSSQRVKRVLHGDCRATFDALSARYQLARFRVEEIRPQFAAFILNSQYMAREHGYHRDFGLEAVIGAQSSPKAVKYLEDVHDASRAFAKAEHQKEADYLCWTLSHLKEHETFSRAFMAAWIMGDVGRLAEMEAVNPLEFEATALGVRDAVVLDRQERWLKTVLAELKRVDTVFVAVGYLHVAPGDGLVSMFGNTGFDVSRL